MTLQLNETIHTSDRLLKRYGKSINAKSFERQLLLYSESSHCQYLNTGITCPFTVIVDPFYCPIHSKRSGQTVAYLRGGKVKHSDTETIIVWWADRLGAFSVSGE